MKIDDLVDYVNRVSEESAKSGLKERYKFLSRKQTPEEARLPVSISFPPRSDGVDDAITSIIEVFKAAGSSPQVIGSRLNASARSRFLGYALWMATQAVRD